jgi:hypothetical protein
LASDQREAKGCKEDNIKRSDNTEVDHWNNEESGAKRERNKLANENRIRRRRTQSSAEQQKNDNKSNFSGRIVAVENLVASFYDPSKLFLVFLFWCGQ